jgi:hypothetical protein
MIEGAVLLHQDDDVLHVIDGTGPMICRNLQRPPDTAGKRRRTRAGGDQPQKRAPISGHAPASTSVKL